MYSILHYMVLSLPFEFAGLFPYIPDFFQILHFFLL